MDSKETIIPLRANIVVEVNASGGGVTIYQGVLKDVDPGSDRITLTTDADGGGAGSDIIVFARDIVNIFVADESVAPAITSRVSDETMEAIYNANSYTRNPTTAPQPSTSDTNTSKAPYVNLGVVLPDSDPFEDLYNSARSIHTNDSPGESILLDESAPAVLTPTDESGIQTTPFTRPVPAPIAPPQSADLELLDDGIKVRSK